MEKTESITVAVSVYAGLRKYCTQKGAGDSMQLSVPEGTTIDSLVRILGIPAFETKQVYVNSLLQEGAYVLKDGERVAVFPPIAGGSYSMTGVE